jgi:PKD repeat protein
MPTSVDAGEEISIDMSGTTDGIGVESYFVDFGDGTDSGWTVKPVLTYEYPSGGTYEVKVKAKDGAGHESVETIVKVTVNENMDTTMLALIIGGGVILIVIVLAILVVVVVRSRHHHYPHHGIHHHPLHPLQPVAGHRPAVHSGAPRALPPHGPLHPKIPPQQRPQTTPQKPVSPAAGTPQPPKRPEIPQPPRPPI